jgi:hypothetical protein
MKKLELKNAFHGVAKRAGTVCMIMFGVWCMAGCNDDDDKKELTGQSGTLTYDDETYTVSVGEIGKDKTGNTYVVLLGVPRYIAINYGKATPVIGAKIVSEGSTFESNKFDVLDDGLKYYFSTKKDPEQILVYQSSDKKTLITFKS